MSKDDARKMTIIEELLSGRFTNAQAAQLLDLSIRQVQRLKSEATANGITIDDATGRILGLYFAKEETFEGYCEVMFQMNRGGHLPREIYTDARTVFVYDSKVKKKLTIEQELAGETERQPQFARALKELSILLIIARSAQAFNSRREI